MPTPFDLVESLSRQSGVPLGLDANGWCMFEVEGLWIALHGTASHLHMHGMIGHYPSRRDDAPFWRDVLFHNTASLKRAGAGISLNEADTLILSRALACDLLDVEAIGAVSAVFIDTLRDLANALRTEDDATASAFPLPNDPSQFLGGPFLAV